MTSSTQVALAELRQKMQSYAPLSEQTWRAMREICRTQMLPKGTYWLKPGQQPDRFAFVHRGLLRIYVTDGQGREYNKMFFAEGSFPGSMAALLEKRQSDFGLQALEDTCLLEIDFAAYRSLLQRFHDLALYQVHYLETNWLRAKDVREVALVQEDAASRYIRFMDEFGYLAHRLPQYHIASHLGITPTQLSRIKKAGIINLCK